MVRGTLQVLVGEVKESEHISRTTRALCYHNGEKSECHGYRLARTGAGKTGVDNSHVVLEDSSD